jgi:hypothetical protein
MTWRRRRFLLILISAAGAAAPAFGQIISPIQTTEPAKPAAKTTSTKPAAARPAASAAPPKRAASGAAAKPGVSAVGKPAVPDFSGIWAHPSLGFEPPVSGPGPVRNTVRLRNGASNAGLLVGDDTNPILKPAAAAIIRKRGEISRSGLAFPDPDNLCNYQPVPYIFWNFEIQILQRLDKVVILYNHDHEWREVRLNGQHPARIKPSWHGDSVGRYEGNTLVIDTVGIRVGKHAMIDRLGTPYSKALHVVERYRLLEYEAAKVAMERGQKEWAPIPAYPVDPDYEGKGLQLEFTVDDAGVFTMPWKATVTYRRALRKEWNERICSENVTGNDFNVQYYSDKDARIPTASKPDF